MAEEELHHFWSTRRPRRGRIQEFIVGDSHATLGNPQYLGTDLEAFVTLLMQEGKFAREDFPREPLLATAVVIYFGEAQNGGHAQVISNTEADPVLFTDIRDGLALLRLDAVQDIWARFERYQKREPLKFSRADWRDPVLQELDNALNPKLRGAYAHLADQAVKWPSVRVLPDADVPAARQALLDL